MVSWLACMGLKFGNFPLKDIEIYSGDHFFLGLE